MKKVLLIIALLLGFGFSNEFYAQKGGKRREHRNQRSETSIFKRQRSAGNADKFAKGAGRKGIIARLFKRDQKAWVYHKTNPGRTQNREQRYLFSRFRTKGKKYREGILARQNIERAKRRNHGNATFSKRKY